jgi:hypothetical protein
MAEHLVNDRRVIDQRERLSDLVGTIAELDFQLSTLVMIAPEFPKDLRGQRIVSPQVAASFGRGIVDLNKANALVAAEGVRDSVERLETLARLTMRSVGSGRNHPHSVRCLAWVKRRIIATNDLIRDQLNNHL